MTENDITICGHGSGTPSTKNLATYCTARYNSIATNGKRKELVAVVRPKNVTDDQRKKFHDKYKTILGRNKYSQPRRNYCYKKFTDGCYYSDCSSSYCLTWQEIGVNIPLLNSEGIYNSSSFTKVAVKIVNGHITNPEILKVGDALLFRGNDSSRTLQIGHIECVFSLDTSTKKSYTTIPVSTTSSGMKILASSLTVRKGPGTTYSQCGSLSKGSTVYPTDMVMVDGKGWFKIGADQWISGAYTCGWIKETSSGKWRYQKEGTTFAWATKTVLTISGLDYCFNKNGYMVESSDIKSDGSIKS